MFKRIVLPAIVLIALVAAYLSVMVRWSYSTGDRAGWVQKLSHKGWLCKTWEGELALVSMPGAPVEKFYFTVFDPQVAADINRHIGKRVALHYEQKMGLPTSCFGDTRYYVVGVVPVEDISLSPGVVIQPAHPAQAASAP